MWPRRSGASWRRRARAWPSSRVSRADQPHAFLHPAIVEHSRGRGQQDGGALRAGVDGEPRLAVGPGLSSGDVERGIGGQRHQPVAAADLHEIGRGPRAGMLIQRLPSDDRERVGAHGLDADLEAAGLDGLLDVLRDAGFELGEYLVLLGDGECQQAVEEARHRRQLLLQVALVDELEAGGILETVERPALDVAAPERDVEAPEGGLGVDALKVVALAEKRLVAASHGGLRIALAAGDRAQAVEPACDRGDEPPLALHVGGDGPEQRRGGLVRPVRSAEPLDGLVGPPSRLQQVVDAALGVGA